MRWLVFISTYSLVAAFAFGQGTVRFENKIGTIVDTPFFDDQGVRLEGPSYVAQLYYWRIGEGFLTAGIPVPFATNDYSGYFFGSTVILPFVGVGLPAWVQVRAWHIGGGTSFEQAALAGAWTGLSEVLFVPHTGDPWASPPTIPAQLIGLKYPGSPLLLRQPQSQSVRSPGPGLPTGERATLSVIASSGVEMAYQWHQQPSDRPDGLIAGATNANYTTPALRTNTTYWVSVSNSAGAVLSDRATITVVSRPPRLTVVQVAGLPVLLIDGVAGTTYRIEYSTNLGLSNWTVLVEYTLRTNSVPFLDIYANTSRNRFYRAVVP